MSRSLVSSAWALLMCGGIGYAQDGPKCSVTLVPVDNFGRIAQEAKISLKNDHGVDFGGHSQAVPCGKYLVAGPHPDINGQKEITVDRPTTVFIYVPGYFGDTVAEMGITVEVKGLRNGTRSYARLFSAYGDNVKETELDNRGKAVFEDLNWGLYVIAILSGENVLAQGTALISPLSVNKTVVLHATATKRTHTVDGQLGLVSQKPAK